MLPAHLPAILSVTLPLCSSSRSRGDDPRHEAAAACGLKVALASGEDGLALLCSELLKGFEDVHKAQGAAELTAAFCKASRLDIQEHVDELMTVGDACTMDECKGSSDCDALLGCLLG